MRRLTPRLTLVLAITVAGCARMGSPIGGPPDFNPPQLLSTTPESLTVAADFDGWVEFQFDEVIAEGAQPNFGDGTGELERLILFSPDTTVPRVRWRRNRISVRPAGDWRPGVVYRVELAPGVRDLRDNRRTEGAVVTLSTGGPIPSTTLRGRVVEWIGYRFAPNALIEAMYLEDSLTYRALTDSAGRFALGPLPAGEYLVRGVLDENSNRRRDARDPWDTVRVAAGRDSIGEIWAFPRDTTPPRIMSATQLDSFTIALTLSQPVDPALRIGGDSVRVLLLPDSASLGAISAWPQAVHDSIYRPIDEARRAAARAAADTSQPARDTTLPLPAPDSVTPAQRPQPLGRVALPEVVADTTPKDLPRESRPALGMRLLIRTRGALQAGSNYRIEVIGVRAMSGHVADTLRTGLQLLAAPKPAATDSTKPVVPPDTVAVPPVDTTPSVERYSRFEVRGSRFDVRGSMFETWYLPSRPRPSNPKPRTVPLR